MFRTLSIAALAATIAFAPVVQACTGIQLVAKDGGVIAARTLEFGIDLQSNVLNIPAGTAMTGTLADGGKGISYTTKYGIGGANGAGQIAILDGINDHGLYVGLFYFPGFASYADATPENAARAMAPYEYGTWLLGNFATVEEVKANFDKVVLVPVVLAALKQVPGIHFVVHDRNGNAVAIEPTDKKLKLFDDPVGVMTNAPTFDWHMTNLRNYINLKPNDVGHIDIGKVELGQFGAGSGMHGLPGDFTPPSRFVRAVAFGACVGHRTASHPAGVPYSQRLRYSTRLGPRVRRGRDDTRIHDLDRRLRSEEPALVLQDLRRSVDPQRRSRGGAGSSGGQDSNHPDGIPAADHGRVDQLQVIKP
jgi:choloylglycine hydrolase